MPRVVPIFQQHHAIEQQTLGNSRLLKALADAGRFNIDADQNLINMPHDKALAQALGVSPHSGGPIREYRIGLEANLARLEQSRDGRAALAGDPEAMDRIAAKVHRLSDISQVGLVNGDLRTNTAVGQSTDQARAQTREFYRRPEEYALQHSGQLEHHQQSSVLSRQWSVVTPSENRVVYTLQHFQGSGQPLIRGGNIELQRNGLSNAIADAHQAGRLQISPGGVLVVESVLGEEAASRLRVPVGQRGGVTLDLLLGEASTHQLIRSGGLLASGADAVMTARRTSQLLEEGNGTAAQSELTHALARNGGGWIGGMATASVIGTSSFVPAAIVAGDALLMSKAFDKGADLLDNRAVYRQTDKADVTWQFNGLNWQRQATMDSAGDGLGNPAERSVGASYEKARELGAYANVKAIELALGKAPPPQDPFSIPARDGEGRLDNPNWHRDAQTEQWTRQVKIGVSGANDRGIYETQTASPERASELNREAVQRIENNIAHGKTAIAASYLETRAATRASDFVPLVPDAVEQARASSDAVRGSDNQLYQRDEAGQWTHAGQAAAGNMALELELTRTIQQPSLEQFNQNIAALEARPLPSAGEMNQNELRHRYASSGVALTSVWEQAIELATTRTREQHGITGPTMQELGPATEGNAGASRPITHYQVGQDGVARAVATTSTQELQAAWNEVRARTAEQGPGPQPAQHVTVDTESQTVGQRREPLQLASPDRAIYSQIREGIAALDGERGRSFDESSERMSASLLVLAKEQGLSHVDRVALSNATVNHPAGHTVFLIQGELSQPPYSLASMHTERAVQTPLEESMQRYEQLNQQAVQQGLNRQLEQQSQDQQAQHAVQGPVMGME
ncbi:hypothetical protein B9Y66_00120 [Stenotrophomonas maltophilia]|nr:hypothetical protein B9Y66_00120 [Stenotrophomonas maltophilia]